MRAVNKIVLASLNADKFREFQALLSRYPEIELIPADSVLRNAEKLPFVETHSTYLENAAAKARLANLGAHYPALADDTGLEVDALGGAPGVRTQRFAQPPKGSAPLSRIEQDRANIELLLSSLKGHMEKPRTARFVTSLALVIEGILVHASGTLEGTIADHPRGTYGFGYDSIFVPKGQSRTLAEMGDDEKNALSHRARAIENLMLAIQARGIVFAKP